MKRYFITTISLFLITALTGQPPSPLSIWYNKHASMWEETLALGNGRLGMMPDGNVLKENIVLNDITLWSGSPQDANNYEANKVLPRIRQLLLEGKNDEAQDLVNKDFVCKGPGSGSGNGATVEFGCYQVLGNLQIDYNYPGQKDLNIKNYKRELTLNNAVATTSYQLRNTTFKREYFTSFGTDVGIIKISASNPGALNFIMSLNRPERSESNVEGKTLQLFGQLDNGKDGKGMQYLAQVSARLIGGGTLTTGEKSLEIKNATEVIIYVSMGTDYKNANYKQTVKNLLNKALAKKYSAEKNTHITNFQKLFNRVKLNLGTGVNSTLPTNERLNVYYQNPEKDLALPVLFYQFGRYLSISSTRVGLLPPNLQGLWANQIQTPWNGDYHLDVNVQMNHWPLEVANLSELNLPLADLVKGLVKNGEKTAKAYYHANGWIAHVITNIWGFTEPGESASWGATNSGSGWLCNNLWEHYEYSLDKKYLKDIYPVLKGSALFYNDALMRENKHGWLVTAPSVSPENSFVMPNGRHANVCMGPTIDNQIVRELFTNVIHAAEVLNVDKALRDTLKNKIKQLPPVAQVSTDGRIMEWLEDYKEADREHRHISHLYGLYPATQITLTKTPELVEPAKKTLRVRTDDGPSWAIAYKMLFWARLQDGEHTFKMLKEILKPTLRTDINYGKGGGVYPNLLSAGPPFQIDGNFGATAAIGEMLIQSHDGFIELIPSIPGIWKTSGEVKGLKARGNYVVDMKWKDGKIINYKIKSPYNQPVKVKTNGIIKTVKPSKI